MAKHPHVRRAWASGRTAIGRVYDTKRELARNIGGWNAKRVAIVDLSPLAIASMTDRLAALSCEAAGYDWDGENAASSGIAAYHRKRAAVYLATILGPLPKPPAPLPRIAKGDTVRLKRSVAIDSKRTATVLHAAIMAEGGCKLSRDLDGIRYWNADDLVRVKRPHVSA